MHVVRESDSDAESQDGDDDDDRRLGSEEVVKSSTRTIPTIV